MKKNKKLGIYIVLVHYPVLNKRGEIVTTAVTTIGLHDIARVGKTYEIDAFFITHPVLCQRELVQRIVNKWKDGIMAEKEHPRAIALSLVRILSSLDEVIEEIEKKEGKKPEIVATSAKFKEKGISYERMREYINRTGNPLLFVFGTGWGLSKEIIEKADFQLRAIEGRSEYNYLSVRSAVAIILDRLFGSNR